MEKPYVDLKNYIQDHRQEMLHLWETLVNTESGSRQIDGVNAVAEILRQEMLHCGMETWIIPMKNAGNTLIGQWNKTASEKPLLFIGHMDTVFPEGAVAKNPFRIDADGHAHGPGVLDMKAGLVIAIYTIKALASIGWKQRPIKCIFAGDEENLHMFSNTPEILAAEARGAAAALNFETGYMDNSVVVGRKGGGILNVTVKGIAAHSGIAPEKGRSAILEAAHKIIEIEGCRDIPRGKLLNCGIIKGGIGENTVPAECQFNIGIRFPTTAIKDEIIADIQKAAEHQHVPDTSASVEIKMIMDCMETTAGVQKLFEQIRRSALHCDCGDVSPLQISGVSDSGITVVNGVPTVCGLGVKGEGNHTAQEYADVESIFERCLLAASTIYDLS